jgi:hypothetical protein
MSNVGMISQDKKIILAGSGGNQLGPIKMDMG